MRTDKWYNDVIFKLTVNNNNNSKKKKKREQSSKNKEVNLKKSLKKLGEGLENVAV